MGNVGDIEQNNVQIAEAEAVKTPEKWRKGQDVGYQTLTRKYFPLLSQLEDVQTFRAKKSDILSAAQKLILKTALSEQKLAKANFLQLLQGFEILNKAERLENNLSTENINTHVFGNLRLENGENEG